MNKTTKAIYFDMDGTIANLYGVDNWLGMLRSYDPTPYREAAPMVDMARLREVCDRLRAQGWIVGVISWLSAEPTKEYDKAVRQAKREWLEKHFFASDETHLVAYGRKKHHIPKNKRGILIDDNEQVGMEWAKHGGWWIDAKNFDIVEVLERLAV